MSATADGTLSRVAQGRGAVSSSGHFLSISIILRPGRAGVGQAVA